MPLKKLTLAVGFVTTSLFAGVNVNNGNFYIAYTDFYQPTAGIGVEVTRTYNSRSSYVRGYFGVGWSSEMESFVKTEGADIVLAEGGGGNTVRFAPQKTAGMWANGTYGPQAIYKEKTGFRLESSNGKIMFFNAAGGLTKVADRNKNYIEYVWSGDHPTLIKDNFNNQIRLSWKEFGKSPRIVLIENGDRKSKYEYSASGDLTRAVGTDNVPYDYAYDDEHNMTKIAYQDGTYKAMTYNKKRDWVISFRDQSGIMNQYDYFADAADPETKFGTNVARFQEGAKEKESSWFWYEFKKKPDGTKFNARSVSWIRGVSTETVYTECCGTPMTISQWQNPEPKKSDIATWTTPKANKRSTIFEYYADGLLKKKTSADGVVTEVGYNDKLKKISWFARAGRRIEYNYDTRGNLEWAMDKSQNRRVDLSYDVKGRIIAVKDRIMEVKGGEERVVYFRYNDSGKPIEIKEKNFDGSEGILKLSYNTNGEVEGLYNQKGRNVASDKELDSAQRVALTFQNLLDIVQPAAVSLTPEG